MSDFDRNDLRAFLAAARAGRLTVAAQRMGVDHSTLSRRLSALEGTLGARLFDRRPSGFALTNAGERLLADAERMESLAIGLPARLDADAHQVGGTVRLGTPEAFGTYFLAPRLAELCTAQPALEVELVANPRSFSLSKREADLAIGMTRPETGRLYARKLVDYALGLYAARRYVEAAETIRSVDDLPRHRWVGYVEDLLWTSELNYLPQVSAAIHPQARISNVITQLEAVRGGAGLAVLPHFLARGCQDLVAVLPEVHIVRAYWLIAHADTRDLPRVRLVSDFLTRQAEAAGNAFWLAPP
ncbi:Glycine cleavage system transcriptional activator [Methylobacterium tardum]|uniref:Transcriptional regulator n=1 Tax=Methylobacterium tardum TaxID=374432 RepID=A0AA37THR4_9HYPH|nr:LysR family transcriptional regulator [Methylobacterium tardum]URD39620.1 LysR family transcriptional regulator [Methylobacterium tardum]GJE48737.1 Glycine cleavage system transcriptional activator [Methylobacterium tardum]GLS72367.1 transcriptional regulator [Methylobacterium tardum]